MGFFVPKVHVQVLWKTKVVDALKEHMCRAEGLLQRAGFVQVTVGKGLKSSRCSLLPLLNTQSAEKLSIA